MKIEKIKQKTCKFAADKQEASVIIKTPKDITFIHAEAGAGIVFEKRDIFHMTGNSNTKYN